MKKIIPLTLSAVILTAGQVCAASKSHIHADTHSVGPHYSAEILPGVSYLRYEESVNHSPFVVDDGYSFGLFGAFTYWDNKYIRLKIDAYFAHAQLNYESASGTMNGEPNNLFEIRGVLGHDFYLKGCRRITPYIGAGYRRLADNSGGMITDLGAMAYDRRANYYYTPIGIDARLMHSSKVDMEVILEYDYLWKGYQKSDDIDSDYSHVNEQDDGYGFKVRFRVLKTVKPNMRLVLEPFFNYWHINDSSLNCNPYFCVIEPYNTSNEYGFRFGMMYF